MKTPWYYKHPGVPYANGPTKLFHKNEMIYWLKVMYGKLWTKLEYWRA
jgi:hypothetical protein